MTIVPINDLSRIDDALRLAVLDDLDNIIRSGTFFRGPFTTRFEKSLGSNFLGRRATCVANGTDALYLALAALGIEAGDSVATVANAGGYSTNAIIRCGARPVYIDVESSTAQMAPRSLAAAIAEEPTIRAVIATHLYGLVGDIASIRELCQVNDLTLVEDCAQAFGATADGQPAGTFGTLATLSFYPTKNLGAFGDAGAVVSSSEELSNRVQSLAQYGWGTRYEITLRGGINSRIDELQSAILQRGLPGVSEQNKRRRAIVLRYQEVLDPTRSMIAADSERFVGHLAVMVTESRDLDIQHLHESGVSTALHYPIGDHRQPSWIDGIGEVTLPNSEWLQDRILTLPCFPTMTESEVQRVIDALRALPV